MWKTPVVGYTCHVCVAIVVVLPACEHRIDWNYRRFEATLYRLLVTEDEDTACLQNGGIFTSLYGVTSKNIVRTQVICRFVKFKRIVGT